MPNQPIKTYPLFATTPKAMEDILAEELRQLSISDIKTTVAGVSFTGTLADAYKVCLWSRIANRVLLVLSRFEVKDAEDLYEGVQAINWFEHIAPTDSFAISFTVKNSRVIRNSHFGALKAKDAVVDQMRKKFNKRPNIDTEQPSIRLNIHLNGSRAQLSLDLSGESLHKRHYRDQKVVAPIKENLAAAMLQRSHWQEIAQQGGSLIDPMCGSGTLLIEAAMIAADYAPGLLRDYFGFIEWKKHDKECWQQLKEEAEQRRLIGMEKMPTIVGFDNSRHVVSRALHNIELAGLTGKIHVEKRDIGEASAAESWQKGLIISNPPYGERLGDEEQTSELYSQFGEVLKEQFQGWQATLIIYNAELGFRLGIRSQKPITLYNGALECKLLRLTINEESHFEPKARNLKEHLYKTSQRQELSENAEMLANRLRKNLKKSKKWAKRQQINSYRLYDADLPEYALAIDLYYGEQLWVNAQEYQAPKSIDPQKAQQRLAEALIVIAQVLEINSENIFLKLRRQQKSHSQYEKHDELGEFHLIEEANAQLLVNFEGYLDTGLFLDHRPIRQLIQQQAKDKDFLNLFAYTGTASVHAAIGGARSTTSIDMSKTYLNWAERNMRLNKNHSENQFIRADCVEWLEKQADSQAQHYDLIFLDPPTFSNSKRMEDNFDIQTQHIELINHATKLLTDTGVLYFSTNFRRFKLEIEALAHLKVEDISAKTIPEDFARNPRIHYCWKIQQ